MPKSKSPFELELQTVLAVAEMRLAFRQDLARQLRVAATRQPRALRSQRSNWKLALASAFLIVMMAILAIGPQQVWAQVLEWFSGYVPGVGFVETENGLRILEEPLIQMRDGVTVTVVEGLIDDQRTQVTILYEGMRSEMRPLSEDDPGCYDPAELVLPDGTTLSIRGGTGEGGLTWFQEHLEYAALPTDVNEVALKIGCLPDVREGAAPEDWAFELTFVPAGEEFEVLPVVPAPTSAATEEPAPHGMQLLVDEWVQLEDGYLFRGRFSWANSPYRRVEFWLLNLELVDAMGQPVPIQVEPDWRYVDSGEPYVTWTARTNRTDLSGKLTFHLPDFSIRRPLEDLPANSLDLDIGHNPKSGQSWVPDQTLELDGRLARIERVTYSERLDGSYELLLEMRLLSEDLFTLNVMDATNRSRGLSWSGTGFEGASPTGTIGIIYDYYPAGEHHFWVDNYFLTLSGPWTTTLDLPQNETSDQTESTPESCVTAATYSSASKTIPTEISGQLLIQDYSNDTLLPSILITEIDGSNVKTIDTGAWTALSSDGRYVAYTNESLRIHDLQTGEGHLLDVAGSAYALSWSPDGSKLAFISDREGLYVVNADGSGVQFVVGSTADMIAIAGWMPDGERLLVSSISPDSSQVQILNLATGEVSDQMVIEQRKGGFLKLSADGEHIAYSQLSLGEPTYSVYIAKLDGSEKRLFAESSNEAAFAAGAWSEDGQWLILNVSQFNDPGIPYIAPLLVNVESCEAFILEGVSGEIIAWAP